MNKNKIQILILGFIAVLIGGLGFYHLVEAAAPSVYVSPASLSKNVGEMFDISVGVNSNGNKVCVAEGKLILDNKLSCKTVKMGDGVMAQSLPSCDNLYFLIGIPGCATSNKTLFTVTVKAGSAGNATANFSGVDIIGEGASISSAFAGGSYTLISPISPPPPCNCTEWSFWQLGDCEVGGCSPIQRLQTRTRTCTPTGCDIENESQCIEDPNCLPVKEEVILPEEGIVTVLPEERAAERGLASLVAAIGMVTAEISQSPWKIIIIIFSLIGLIIVGVKEWKRTQDKKEKV